MGESHRLQSFAEDLVVFRQLTTPEERTEFSTLMKRAYAQHICPALSLQRSPARRVSTRIRRLCERTLPREATMAVDGTRPIPDGTRAEGTDFPPQYEP